MLNLYHLKYFRDACRAGSLSSSAQTNRVTHSAVSQAIQALERELGCKLLLHAKRKFLLTREGQRLFEKAGAIFDTVQDTMNFAQAENTELTGPLRVGFSHSIGKHLIARKLQTFVEANPAVELQISIGNSRALENLLASKEIELGIGVEDGSFAAYDRTVLEQCAFVLIARKLKRQNASTLIVGDKGPEVRALRAQIAKSKKQFTFHEVQSWTLIYEMVLLGMGTGLVPDFVYQSDRKQLALAPLDVRLPSVRLCAFYRSALNLSPSAKAFLSHSR